MYSLRNSFRNWHKIVLQDTKIIKGIVWHFEECAYLLSCFSLPVNKTLRQDLLLHLGFCTYQTNEINVLISSLEVLVGVFLPFAQSQASCFAMIPVFTLSRANRLLAVALYLLYRPKKWLILGKKANKGMSQKPNCFPKSKNIWIDFKARLCNFCRAAATVAKHENYSSKSWKFIGLSLECFIVYEFCL